MPVALAIAATDRSISAHRITKVRPTAMIAVTEIWVRMLAALSTVAKEGLAALKKATSAKSVTNGAMLRNWPRSHAPARPPPSPRARSAGAVMLLPPSGRLQQPVLADGLVREFADDLTLLHDDDPVGERQHRLGLAGDDHDAEPLVAQAAHDLHHVVLGAHVHAARGLAEDQHLRRIGEPLGERDLLLVAARERAEFGLHGRRADVQPLDVAFRDPALHGGLQQEPGDAAEDANGRVLVDGLLVEEHGAPALGHEGDA